ncbi:MAG: MBL fold metallo-hydrolase [Microgenomates group bacterium]
MNIEFLGGAGGEVTGSCVVVTSSRGSKVMIDCGVFQGSSESKTIKYEEFGFDPNSLQAVFISHAHLDHTGRLPALVAGGENFEGYSGNIYMTPPTRELTGLILEDQMRVVQKKRERSFYNSRILKQTLGQMIVVDYRKEFEVGDFTVGFYDAGHILGSSSIRIKEKGRGNPTIAVSGDLGGNFKHRIGNVDIAIEESTYGDRNRPYEDPEAILQEEVNRLEGQGRGVVMIPAFSVGRTQKVQNILYNLKKTGRINKNTLVRLESPMGRAATKIHQKYFNMTQKDNYDYHFEDIYNTRGMDHRINKQQRRKAQPMVVIAGSGMMDGGKIRSYFAEWGPDAYSTILFVGYLAEGSLGRQIAEGAEMVDIDGQDIPVNCRVRKISALSSHLDQDGLIDWAAKIRSDSQGNLNQFILVHGEEDSTKALGERIEAELNTRTYSPKLREVLTF